jgi:hypothetical protein
MAERCRLEAQVEVNDALFRTKLALPDERDV